MADLYGDIKLEDHVQDLEYKEKYEQLLETRDKELSELKELRAKVGRFESATGILERNICCLYETARQEIQRKDALIADVRNELGSKTVALKKLEFLYKQERGRAEQRKWIQGK